MNAWLDAFHFLRPWWLLLACVWVPWLLWRMRRVRQGTVLQRLADAELLPHLLVRSGRAQRWPWLLAGLAGVLMTLALAGPAWQRVPQPVYQDGAAQVVVVSLSQRMLARDVKPDRMQRVRYKVHDLMHANASGRNGLVAYAGAAFTVAPLTTDARALDDLVDALAPDVMPVPGNDAAKGIERGAQLLAHGGVDGGSVVVVTDTIDAEALAAARRVHAKGVRISVLGVGKSGGVSVRLPGGRLLTDATGNPVTARRDDASLRALADAGGGIYVPMRSDHADIKALSAELRDSRRARTPSTIQSERWRDVGPWLLLPLLLLAALAFRRGWLLLLPLVLLPWMPLPARASDAAAAAASSTGNRAPNAADTATSGLPSWSSLWRNGDQRAVQALAAGDPRRAERLARSPAWRGAAAYRAGDFAAAAKAFTDAPGAGAAYNLGNALAKQGRYREAIKAYDKALQLDPDNADAHANRKAVRAWLHQHSRKTPDNSKSTRGKSGADAGKQHDGGRHASRSDRQDPRHGPGQASSAASHAPPAPASSHARSQPASAGSSGQKSQAGRAPDAEQASKQQVEARRASRALHQAMQGKTKGKTQAGQSDKSFDLGAASTRAASTDPLPKSMRRALQRVPDDPGGLLRRKFLLQYQQRHDVRRDGGRR